MVSQHVSAPAEFRRAGFTMVELLAVVAIIGVLIGILLPAVQAAREGARRISCTNNQMQVGLAVQAYHQSHRQYPIQLSGTDGSAVQGEDNDRRLSIFVALAPFLEDRTVQHYRSSSRRRVNEVDEWGMLYEFDEYEDFADDGMQGMGSVASDEGDNDEELAPWPAGGPEPFVAAYWPWSFELPVLRCPSDPGAGLPSLGRTNYAACLGDGIVAMNTGPFKDSNGTFVITPQLEKETGAAMRGVFVPRVKTSLRDVKDGQSNTILLAEIATDLGDGDVRTQLITGPGEKVLRDDPLWVEGSNSRDLDRPNYWNQGVTPVTGITTPGRGFRWADGMPVFTGVNTIRPPNSAIVGSGNTDDTSGLMGPSSRHQGGAHVCMVDGAIRFVTNSIDTGDQSARTPYLGSPAEGKESPYGVWGAMGTRASGEIRFAE